MLRIRSATPDDVLAILALERTAAGAAHWSPEQYRDILSSLDRVVLIAESDGCVQGFLVARCGIEWEIENLVVAEKLRNQGVGTQLVGELLDLARSRAAETLLLEVRESNTAARTLYEKLHFKETGRRKAYYRDPDEDGILYSIDWTYVP
jgi:[ribosomal protein S18]-alanine N-acetyltransferase